MACLASSLNLQTKPSFLSHCTVVLLLSESLGLHLQLKALRCACFSACLPLSAGLQVGFAVF